MHRTHRSDLRTAGLTVPEQDVSHLADSRATRVGNEDRQHAVDLLQAHYVAGRLDSVELEGRIERALSAKTLADLDALLADLPRIAPASGATAEQRRERQWNGNCVEFGLGHDGREKSFRAHATSYVLVMVLLIGIWLMTTPGGYFWPVWPMLGWGIGLASHGLATLGLANAGSGWRDHREAREMA